MFTNASSVYIGGKEVQSIVTSNGGVLYQKSSPSPSTVSSISLSSSSNILSAYHSESATLTATATDSNSNPVENATIEFFNGSTSLGTSTTNSSGVATKSYSATGVGDVSLTATSGNVSSSAVTVEDCIFYLSDEISRTKGSSTLYEKLYDNISSSLPNKFEWSMDMKTTNVSTSSEQRVFLAPTYSSNSQPSNGIFFQFGSSACECGTRTNSSTSGTGSVSATTNTYYHFKFIRNGNTLTPYINTTQKTAKTTPSWIDNQTNWLLSLILWKTGTLTWKNMKIKAL